jgi:dissimilatory sulfite reductase (desulfoviridin) alpha/beta subunit
MIKCIMSRNEKKKSLASLITKMGFARFANYIKKQEVKK